MNCAFLLLRENCNIMCTSDGSWQQSHPGCPGSQLFTTNGTFVVPKGVKLVRVLLVGGGGSGVDADRGGGGGGYVECGNVDVSNVTNLPVIVGYGGSIGPSAGGVQCFY